MGSLLPVDNNPPKFTQLYIYDTENEIQNRMSIFTSMNSSNSLNENIITKLIIMLDEINILVKLFRFVKKFYNTHKTQSMKLRLIGNEREMVHSMTFQPQQI